MGEREIWGIGGNMQIDYCSDNLTGRVIRCIIQVHQVILELKTVESLSKAHYAQVRSYLRATRLDLALLVNFAGDRADFRRVSA